MTSPNNSQQTCMHAASLASCVLASGGGAGSGMDGSIGEARQRVRRHKLVARQCSTRVGECDRVATCHTERQFIGVQPQLLRMHRNRHSENVPNSFGARCGLNRCVPGGLSALYQFAQCVK